MSRRILLIDGDTEFRDTLTKQVGRYRVIVMTEPNADRALSMVASDPPDLAIIAVEEPDKSGFKTFQKARKSLPAKLPIVLVTKSMSADSFAKHRSLKVHADEYIDKRGLTTDELVGKIDNLIGLGDLQEDDVSIPVEDEIPMEIADGDVVLDEQLDEDDPAAEFGSPHEMATVGGNNTMLVDQMVSQETDAAFDALLGDEPEKPRGLPGVAPIPEPVERAHVQAIEAPEPAAIAEPEPMPVPEPIAEPVPEPIEAAHEPADMSGIPEPVPHKIPDVEEPPAPPKSEWDEKSIPERIMDGGRSTGSYDALEDDGLNPATEIKDEDLPEPPPLSSKHKAVDLASETASAPSVHAEDEHLAPVVVDEEGGHEVSMSSIPIDDDDLVSLDDDAIEEIEDAPEPAAEPVATPTLAAPPVETHAAHAASDEMPPVAAVMAEHARAKRATGSQASIDLGLDKLAQDAESEQSGVYDRKSLRKIGELERQIAQLKAELERARADADKAAKGGSRESQFLNLRESNLAKEKELKQAKTSLEQQSKELAEAQEKLRQALQAKQTLEAKNSEIEQKLEGDTMRVKELAASLRDATSQASQLEQELEAKTKACETAEKTLAQVEKDLANERASGAASASEAERKLRGERDQMLVRHKGELAALRAEVEARQELAMGRLREELDAERTAAVQEAIEETRRAAASQHADAVAKLEHKHNEELIAIKSEHAGELSRTKSELGSEIERIKGELAEAQAAHSMAVAAAAEEREAALAAAKQELDAALTAAEQARDVALANAKRERDATVARAQQERDAAIARAEQDRDAALAARETEVAAAQQDRDAKVAAAEQARETEVAAANKAREAAVSQANYERETGVAEA
ncbi:MAG TPA: response regulator, partial [Kofleriaceae bacterium]